MTIVERILMSIQDVVHLPELALRPRCLSRLRGMFGMRMQFRQRKIAKHETQPVAELAPDFVDDRIRFAAVWALVIAIFHQRDRRGRRPANMIPRAHWQSEFAVKICSHFPFSCADARSSSAARIPSAPGFTP